MHPQLPRWLELALNAAGWLPGCVVRLLSAKRPISKGLRIQVRPCSPSRSQARDRLLAWTDLPPYFLPFLSPLLFSRRAHASLGDWGQSWLLQPSPPKAVPKLFLKGATLLGPKKRDKMTIIKVTLHPDSSPETRSSSWPLTPVISEFLSRRFRPGQIARLPPLPHWLGPS